MNEALGTNHRRALRLTGTLTLRRDRDSLGSTPATVIKSLHAEHFDDMFNYLRALLPDPGDAEELAGTVFLTLLTALPDHQAWSSRELRELLFTITHREVINHGRAETVPQLDVDSELSPSDPGLQTTEPLELFTAVTSLPWLQRSAILLLFSCGFTTDESARIMGMSSRSVPTLQQWALIQLNQSVGRAPVGTPSCP